MAPAPQSSPDLTVPVAVIVACAVVIVVALVAHWLVSRRRRRSATPEQLASWQSSGGRLLDQWMTGVEAELATLRTSPFPDTVTPTEDPLGLDQAIADCPDGALARCIADLRAAADAMLRAARAGDPNRPQVDAAEARYREARGRAAARLEATGSALPPQ